MEQLNESVLWKGSIPSKSKKITLFASLVLIIIDLIIILLVYLWFLSQKNLIQQILLYSLFGVLGIAIIVSFRWVLAYYLNLFPQFLMTSKELILKKWTFFGNLRVKSLALDKIRLILVGDGKDPDFIPKNTFFFSETGFNDIIEKNPSLKKSKFLDFDFFALSDYDFQFYGVNSPEKLLKALKNAIPLQNHSILKKTFERIC